MEMPRASDADKERFRAVVPDLPEVVIKPMFGNLGAFVNGNMFAGLFGPTIGVKLGEADKETLESTERTIPFAACSILSTARSRAHILSSRLPRVASHG